MGRGAHLINVTVCYWHPWLIAPLWRATRGEMELGPKDLKTTQSSIANRQMSAYFWVYSDHVPRCLDTCAQSSQFLLHFWCHCCCHLLPDMTIPSLFKSRFKYLQNRQTSDFFDKLKKTCKRNVHVLETKATNNNWYKEEYFRSVTELWTIKGTYLYQINQCQN